jgi:hypothetical protein
VAVGGSPEELGSDSGSLERDIIGRIRYIGIWGHLQSENGGADDSGTRQ